MPTVPRNNFCNILGCKQEKFFGSAYCQEHGGVRTKNYDANSELYNSSSWKRIRSTVLRINPICQSCLSNGIVVQADVVDHVFPHRRDKHKFIHNVFQSLCVPCHTQKTKWEKRGIYEYFGTNPPQKFSDKDYVRVFAEHQEKNLRMVM